MINRDNYINIQGWMVTDLGLKGNELLIYAIIYGFTQDGEHKFKGSLNYLASWTNSTKQGIIKALKKLIEKNLIVKEEFWENNVKFCEYHVTKFNDTIKQSLMDDAKQSLINNIDNNNINNNKQQIDKQFADFYSAYPRKVGKAEARKKYEAALKKDSAEKILNGVKQYCKEINANKTEKQFIKHPSTWLNQQCWLDYDDIIETEVVDFEQKMRDECYKRMLKEGQITEDEFNKYWENRGKEIVWQ